MLERTLRAIGGHLRVFGIAVVFGLSVYALLIVFDALMRLIGLREP